MKSRGAQPRFSQMHPAGTRIELEHRKLERHGVGWKGVGGEEGRPLYLQRFAALVAERG